MSEKLDDIEFGEYRIDRRNKRLMRRDEHVPLTPKVFETLEILVQNAGSLVEKSQLMELIWPDRFVEESNLTFNIKMLRKAFNDSPAEPRYIETVPRRGYRFVAEINSVNSEVSRQIAVVPVAIKGNGYLRTFVLAGFFAVVCLILVGMVFKRQISSANAVVEPAYSLTAERLTDNGTTYQAAISKDGRSVVYSSLVNGKESLWVRDLESSANTQLLYPSEDSYLEVAFSPNGRTIYFVRGPKDGSSRPAIYKMPAIGGVPIKLAERSEGTLAISPNGREITFIRYDEGSGDRNKLFTLDIESKTERNIASSEHPNVFWGATYTNDGKHLAVIYGESNNHTHGMGIYQMPADGGKMESISPQFLFVSSLRWLGDDRGLVITARESIGESKTLWHLDNSSHTVRPMSDGNVSYERLSCDAGCNKIVATTVMSDFKLYTANTDRSEAPNELTQARDGVSYAPNGRLVYASDSAANEDIWIMDIDGSNQKQLTTSIGVDAYPKASARGDLVAFMSNRTGAGRVWSMKVDGTEQTQLTETNGGAPIAFSGDGQWIYYIESTSRVIWKVNTAGGGEVPLIDKKLGYDCALSPNTETLACFARDQKTRKIEIRLFNSTDGVEKRRIPIPETENIPYSIRFSHDGTGVTYSSESFSGQITVWRQSIDDSSEAVKIRVLGGTSVLDSEISPDGKILSFIQGRWKHDLTLLTLGSY